MCSTESVLYRDRLSQYYACTGQEAFGRHIVHHCWFNGDFPAQATVTGVRIWKCLLPAYVSPAAPLQFARKTTKPHHMMQCSSGAVISTPRAGLCVIPCPAYIMHSSIIYALFICHHWIDTVLSLIICQLGTYNLLLHRMNGENKWITVEHTGINPWVAGEICRNISQLFCASASYLESCPSSVWTVCVYAVIQPSQVSRQLRSLDRNKVWNEIGVLCGTWERLPACVVLCFNLPN